METNVNNSTEPQHDAKLLVICRCYAVFRLDNLGEYTQQSVWFNSIEEAVRYLNDYERLHSDRLPEIFAKVSYNGI